MPLPFQYPTTFGQIPAVYPGPDSDGTQFWYQPVAVLVLPATPVTPVGWTTVVHPETAILADFPVSSLPSQIPSHIRSPSVGWTSIVHDFDFPETQLPNQVILPETSIDPGWFDVVQEHSGPDADGTQMWYQPVAEPTLPPTPPTPGWTGVVHPEASLLADLPTGYYPDLLVRRATQTRPGWFAVVHPTPVINGPDSDGTQMWHQPANQPMLPSTPITPGWFGSGHMEPTPTVPSPYIPSQVLSAGNYRLSEEVSDSLRQPGIGETDSYRLNPD